MDRGYIQLYPIVRFGPLLNATELDLQASETVTKVRQLLLLHAAQPASVRNEFSRLSCKQAKYELIDPKNFALERRLEFWNALALPNYVLLRGVYALMKSDMLCRHYDYLLLGRHDPGYVDAVQEHRKSTVESAT